MRLSSPQNRRNEGPPLSHAGGRRSLTKRPHRGLFDEGVGHVVEHEGQVRVAVFEERTQTGFEQMEPITQATVVLAVDQVDFLDRLHPVIAQDVRVALAAAERPHHAQVICERNFLRIRAFPIRKIPFRHEVGDFIQVVAGFQIRPERRRMPPEWFQRAEGFRSRLSTR